eukprot:1168285-Amphidinium_carterae.2
MPDGSSTDWQRSEDDLLLTYPLNHVVTSGDTVRVCGKGFNKKKVFKVARYRHVWFEERTV